MIAREEGVSRWKVLIRTSENRKLNQRFLLNWNILVPTDPLSSPFCKPERRQIVEIIYSCHEPFGFQAENWNEYHQYALNWLNSAQLKVTATRWRFNRQNKEMLAARQRLDDSRSHSLIFRTTWSKFPQIFHYHFSSYSAVHLSSLILSSVVALVD